MRKGRFNYAAGVLLIIGALMLYLGGGYYLIQTAGEPIALYTITLCPFWVLSIGVAVALRLLDASRSARECSPRTLLPALLVGLALCVVTSTPALWFAYTYNAFQFPMSGMFALGVLTVEWIRSLADRRARGAPFEVRRALIAVRLVLLLYLPGALVGLLSWPWATQPTVHRVCVIARNLVWLFSGAVGLWAVHRNRRGAGIALLAIAVSGFALYLTANYGVARATWSDAFLKVLPLPLRRIWLGLARAEVLSAFSFCLFGGIKCLLPEKKS